MKRRIATERLTQIYIARCGYTWLDESNWPQEWPISPITIVYLKIPSEILFHFLLGMFKYEFVVGLIGHSWAQLDSSNHVHPHLAIKLLINLSVAIRCFIL